LPCEAESLAPSDGSNLRSEALAATEIVFCLVDCRNGDR